MKAQHLSHPRELLPWYANGTLEGKEWEQVEEHLRTCLACRREVEELRKLQQVVVQEAPEPPAGGLDRFLEAVREAESADRESGRMSRRWFPPWAAKAAAALVAVVGVSLWFASHRPETPDPSPRWRAVEEAEVLRSLLPPGEPLPRDAFVLRWEVAPEWQEARFSLTVTTEALDPLLAVEELEATEFRVPPEVLEASPPGARLLWRIEAVRPDGARRAEVFAVQLP